MQLWKSDGTGVVDASMDYNYFEYTDTLAVVGSNLYFAANDGTHGVELWKHNGTTASLVADVETGGGSSDPAKVTLVGSDLYFTADTPGYGRELWKVVGTTSSMVADINTGGSSSPSQITVVGSTLYFFADDGKLTSSGVLAAPTAKTAVSEYKGGTWRPYQITGTVRVRMEGKHIVDERNIRWDPKRGVPIP